VEQAIETIYKRDKASVLKKHQYEQAVEVVKQLETRLRRERHSHANLHNVIILQQNPELQPHPHPQPQRIDDQSSTPRLTNV
jgi:hypothetical protein